MSQEKAQLIAPLGIMTVTGMTATGVITATSFTGSVVGSAKSLVNGSNVSVGVITATSFAGNLTGNILRLADSAPNIVAGVSTATSFVGNLTGSVTDLTSAPAITVGMVTATTLEGPVTGNVTGNVSGLAGGLGVNYNGGWAGAGTSQINAGVVTATTFYGDGSNLEGVSSGPVSGQSIGITSATTSIDLSNGNLIYATQSASTTVSFASTANGNVYFVRTKDDTSTARTITWPDRIKWNGGTAPTLLDNPRSTDAQVFLLVTRDMGVTWYGKEVVNVDPQTFSLFSWGDNQSGRLGLNDGEQNNKLSSPVQVGTATNWRNFSTGYTNSGANATGGTKADGTLWLWGSNAYGQLGQNARTQRSSPIQVGTDTTWNRLTNSASYCFLSTKSDGTLWGWGSNSYSGPLGQNNKTNRSSPTQIPGSWGTGEFKVGGGNYSVFAIKEDGSLWCWGHSTYGKFGRNGAGSSGGNIKVQRSSPVQVGTDTTWSKLLMGGRGGAIKTDGTLWMWGGNDGLLGLNDLTYRSSPVQVGTDTTWKAGTMGFRGNHALKTDGTLWAWGKSQVGCLGLNVDDEDRSSPTQLPGTNWATVDAGQTNSVYATKTDGTAWAWGYNENGQLGDNSKTNRSSPIQIPGTTWGFIAAGQYNGFGLQKAG